MAIRKIESCTSCDLHKTRRTVVKGRGVIPSDVLFIGEGPGKVEDLFGEAFIGEAGQLFDELIEDAEQNTGCQVTKYFTNIVLCHPTDSLGGDNRTPSRHEILMCTVNVMQIYREVSPSVVVFVGSEAQKAYKNEFKSAYQIVHPSFLLRQGGGKSNNWYIHNLRILEEVFSGVTEKKNHSN